MTTATQLRREFQEYLEENGMYYGVVDGPANILILPFGGHEHDTHVFCEFEEADGPVGTVRLCSQDFAQATDFQAALEKINQINEDYRWVTTFMDAEGLISADLDALVHPGTVGMMVGKLAFTVSDIVEAIIDELQGVAVPCKLG
ncbi:MAG: YbjN domain-containing protein [Eggerthellaceae bacterium]